MKQSRERMISDWRSRIRPAVWAAVFSCFAAGFLAHIFAFTNIIPNADGISRVNDAQQMTISGRWFLHYATMWNGFVQAPAVIGFFSLLFLSLAAGLTADLLKIRNPVLGGLCGALMAAFPTIAYTFLYLFTASAYCFGILLAVLAVWLIPRHRFGWLFAAPILACALGTYQAYLAVAASLSLICVLLYALEGKHSGKEIFLTGLRYLACLALSLLLYYGLLRLFLWVKELELLNYKGIGSMTENLNPNRLLGLIGSAYRDFFQYYFVPHKAANYTTPVFALGNGLLFLAGLWAFLRLFLWSQKGRKPSAVVLILVLCGLLPLACDLTVLMSDVMPVMRYALVFPYVLALALTDRAGALQEPKTKAPRRGRNLLSVAAVLAAALIWIVSFNIDNLAYTVSTTAHRATQSFVTRLVERVEATPGYSADMEVVVIGGFPSKSYYSTVEDFDLVTDYSNLPSSVIPLNKHVYYYLNDWLNVRWQEPPEQIMIAVSNSEAFRAMPRYPSDGSIAILEGRVVVKLAERYTPKKDYEIAYENRR